jgi:hypothetical protein
LIFLIFNLVSPQAAIQIGAYMLEKFYPSHVIGRLPISEEEFWEEKVSFDGFSQ